MCVVIQFMHSLTSKHLNVVCHILRYFKETFGRGLLFKKNENRGIMGYLDADWVSSIEDSRSTSGYCTKVWGNLVT